MATLLLSQGVPMLLAGDEFLRTQGGNNNAWCQDNAISWVDWTLAEANKDFQRFAREMIWLRKRHPALRRRTFLDGGVPGMRSDITWHGLKPLTPDFSASSRAIAYTLDGLLTGREPDQDFYVAINGGQEPAPFVVPPAPSGRPWRRVVDTAQAPPDDIVGENEGPVAAVGATYTVPSMALAVLISEQKP
jgi:glycogen operon protein